MLVKILGAIDVISGLILIFGANNKLPSIMLIILGVALMIKAGIGLFKDFASWIDFCSGVIFILLIFFQIPWVICIIAGVLVLQKGIFSVV